MRAALPSNERERLASLHQLRILDTPHEQSFDEIAQLAMTLCDVPIAVVSLVDRDRQWFKSCLGLDASETPRDLAFCAHAILAPNDLTVVEDALLDERFKDNGLVLGEPYIRFYAGAPLITAAGHALGTLCIIDRQPRQMSALQLNTLKLLARQVMQLLQLREANIALQHERENLDDVLNGANLGTWRWNVQTGEVIFNERWADMIGYCLAELAPLSISTWVRLVHPDDFKMSNSLLEKHFAGELEYYECQCRMKHKEGHWVSVLARGRLISRTAENLPLWVSGTHSDVTELHESRLQLQESEERLQAMIGNFPGAVYRCENDPRWTMLYLSSTVEQLTGYGADHFMGNNPLSFTDLTHSEDVPRVFERVQQALKNQERFHLIYRMQHRDLSWRWVEEVGCGVYDQQNDLKYIDGFIWDITTAEKARKSIALNEQKLSALFAQAPVAIILNDFADGRFLECNPEFERIIGYTSEEIAQLSYMDITPPEFVDADKRELQNLLDTGRYGPYEKLYIHKDGHLIPVLLNGMLIKAPTGEQQIWAFIQDITERKRIEQMKNEFVSAVSHELRTPLTAISGALGLLAGGMLGALPDKVEHMLGIAYKNSQRLTLLINDLLDMEKLLAGKMAFNMQVQLLQPIVIQALEDNKSYADTYGVRLSCRNNFSDLWIKVDAQRLQQVLANFISNAVKFSPEQGEVDIIVSIENGLIKIAVVDYGPGVSEEFRTRIFQKFSQADASSSRQRGGTGLGLSISKEFVERMQGQIGFDSISGEGATFYATFPVVIIGK
jgi:PAS domain S-box-containing protein